MSIADPGNTEEADESIGPARLVLTAEELDAIVEAHDDCRLLISFVGVPAGLFYNWRHPWRFGRECRRRRSIASTFSRPP